jgi:hypothetical protein
MLIDILIEDEFSANLKYVIMNTLCKSQDIEHFHQPEEFP